MNEFKLIYLRYLLIHFISINCHTYWCCANHKQQQKYINEMKDTFNSGTIYNPPSIQIEKHYSKNDLILNHFENIVSALLIFNSNSINIHN